MASCRDEHARSQGTEKATVSFGYGFAAGWPLWLCMLAAIAMGSFAGFIVFASFLDYLHTH